MPYIFLAIGLVAGYLLRWLIKYLSYDGVLKIDISDPDKDLYFLEFDTDLDKLPNHPMAYLRIKRVSHE